jgi:methanogenic corrinoid protein MtbC1
MEHLNRQVCDALDQRRAELAAHLVARTFALRPAMEVRYPASGRERCREDAGHHLAYLAQSIAADSPELFCDYIGWAKVMLAQRGVPAADLGDLLETMMECLQQQLPVEQQRLACSFVAHALGKLPQMPDQMPSQLPGKPPMTAQYLAALLAGERHVAAQLILAAAAQGTDVRDLYLQVMAPVQREVGRLWQSNRISVGQEHYCTAATQLIMSQLYPYVFATPKTRGTMVAASVAGDLHELGVRIVCDFLELDGWNTHYLGANVPMSSVIGALMQQRATLLALSATTACNVGAVEALIVALRLTPGCRGVKVIVGGYPFNAVPDLWKAIGADGSANDARGAVELVGRLMNQGTVT